MPSIEEDDHTDWLVADLFYAVKKLKNLVASMNYFSILIT